MAYIPPHKRHSKDSKRPSPIPELLLAPQSSRNLNLKSSKHSLEKSGNIVYAENAIVKWFIAGFDADNNQFPYYLHLEPISLESFEQRMRKKPLVLLSTLPATEKDEDGETKSSTPSESMAANVWPDLLSTFEIVRNKMETKELDRGKPTLMARVGKILFHGSPSVNSENVKKDQVTETILRQMYRTFDPNTCSSYMENIINDVVPKIGVVLAEEKDTYHIKLSDSTQPNLALLCKCRLTEDKKLELYKVERNPIRHMLIDISCIDKNLDLRLALHTKRILTALTDDEMHNIRNIINSAIIDPEVKGGLRWPLGKACSGDQYAVIGVWLSIAKKYKCPSFRLKARHVDRFDFKAAMGESTIEVSLKLKSIVSRLQEEKVETDSIFDMFKENLRMIWDHFLCCSEQYFA